MSTITSLAGAPLPSLERPCTECDDLGLDRWNARCSECQGCGTVTSDPPDRCPWCWARDGNNGELDVSRFGMVYCCAAKEAFSYEGDVSPEDSGRPFGDHEGDGRCLRVPADVAAVITDLCAERGWDLMAALMGEECELCFGTGTDGCNEPGCDSEGTQYLCVDCHGAGRVVHADVRNMLAPYRTVA